MKLSEQNYIACIGFAIMGALGLYFATESKFSQPMHVLLNTKTAVAKVANSGSQHVMTRSGMSAESFHFPYTFEVSGTEYSGNAPFSKMPNATETIEYVADNPANNGPELKALAKFELGIYFVILCAFFIPIGAITIHHISKRNV